MGIIQEWLKIEEGNDFLRISFQCDNLFINPAVIPELNGKDFLKKEKVFIQGRAGLWTYSAIALLFSEETIVAVLDPKLEAYVVITPQGEFQAGDLLDPETGKLLERIVGSGSLPKIGTKSVRSPVSGRAMRFGSFSGILSPVCLQKLPGELDKALSNIGEEFIYWDSPAPVWFVSSLSRILFSKFKNLAGFGIYSANEEGVVVVHSNRDDYIPGIVLREKSGNKQIKPRLIGIVGDPNSGKSVFSWKLYQALQKLGVRCYRLDCDFQAPTALWGITTEMGRNLRKTQKRPWKETDIQILLQIIARLKSSGMEIIILDLPGGIHKPGIEPIRIPAGREKVFSEIQEYIIVQRDDSIAQAWREAIAKVNPSARTDIEVLSRMRVPDKPSILNKNKYRPSPLERENVYQDDAVIEALAKQLLTEKRR